MKFPGTLTTGEMAVQAKNSGQILSSAAGCNQPFWKDLVVPIAGASLNLEAVPSFRCLLADNVRLVRSTIVTKTVESSMP